MNECRSPSPSQAPRRVPASRRLPDAVGGLRGDGVRVNMHGFCMYSEPHIGDNTCKSLVRDQSNMRADWDTKETEHMHILSCNAGAIAVKGGAIEVNKVL
jgi:hypothetical protein